ncbi:MAG: hypothetical protein CMC78_03190 [Flavobacteriaceae bacterium]|nr:hypothetical protein [Flavobacteriaceae bacterium]
MAITLNGSGTATGLTAAPNLASSGLTTGKILQVKQTKLTTAVSISGTTSYADISGFSVSITPTSASNKILVMVQMNVSSSGEYIMKLIRNAGGSNTDIGNSTAGNYTSFTGGFQATDRSGYYDFMGRNFNFLDDAQDTNAHTYKVGWSNITAITTYLNRTGYSATGANYSYSGSSSITVYEVAA